MEQKGLDEIEESFLGEEIIEDEVSLVTETKPKSEAKKKVIKKAEVKTESKVSEKKEAVETKEDVKISPAISEEKVEIKVEKKQESIFEAKPTVSKNDNKSSGTNAWAILSGVLVALLLVSVFTNGYSFGNSGDEVTGAMSLPDAASRALSFVNNNLLPPGVSAEIIGTEDTGELYKVTLSVAGNEVDSYITKSGSMFFPSGIDITEEFTVSEEAEEVEVQRVEVSVDDDAVKGDVNAPVTIVEFSDYECPFCGRFYSQVLPLIEENYIDTGIVKLVFRDFPLSFHPDAEPAAVAAECAGEQDAYFEMHNALFENQADLSDDLYLSLAEELGLDVEAFELCLSDEEILAEVRADLADGEALGVTGTPAFFVNGESISGAQPYEVFVAAIDRALADLEDVEEVVEEVTEEEVVEEVVAEEPVVEETTEEVVAEEPAEVVVEETVAEVSASTVSIETVAKKWRFDPSDFTVSAGDIVEMTITPDGMDVFTFAIAGLGVEEVIDGVTTFTFEASVAGTYEMSCASCEDWRGMTADLIVE